MKSRLLHSLLIALLILTKCGPAESTEPPKPRDMTAKLRNDRAQFTVRVAVDREDRTYAAGEKMAVTVRSERAGYLYLLYTPVDGKTKCLFPNSYDSANRIAANEDITVPTEKQGFDFTCNPPFGEETLTAIVSEKPLTAAQLDVESLTQSVATEVDIETIAKGLKGNQGCKDMDVTPSQPAIPAKKWAEHSVSIKTISSRAGQSVKCQRRIGLFIGVTLYTDPGVPDLTVCHKDAKTMADTLKTYGQLDEAIILVDKEATREKIEKAFEDLKRKSKPGDVVVIYWSGHGATCADVGGDEADGIDEFLIPHDGDLKKVEETMVMDDALGRWIQELDGRQLIIIFDACHSGGQAVGKGIGAGQTRIKGLGHIGPKPAQSADDGNPDFFDSEIGRIKDIGQRGTAMLFSCAANEISAERVDETLSVMTHYLVEKIKSSSELTLQEAADYVKDEVPKYMKKEYPDYPQHPQSEGDNCQISLR